MAPRRTGCFREGEISNSLEEVEIRTTGRGASQVGITQVPGTHISSRLVAEPLPNTVHCRPPSRDHPLSPTGELFAAKSDLENLSFNLDLDPSTSSGLNVHYRKLFGAPVQQLSPTA
ncbi:hypothetical protein JHW43_007486 [Diplocarpon mali]|nr:hypothetical protein JHW43_007486 [Diplocarpon mali]